MRLELLKCRYYIAELVAQKQNEITFRQTLVFNDLP